jgi:putative ABC transport system substrate-binding protein
MQRRTFIALMGGLTVGVPLAARAQKKVPRIGILTIGGTEAMGPFQDALRELGYVEGESISYELRSAGGRLDRLPQLAAELVRSRVDIIVASQTPPVEAAKNATRDIPIVMGAAGDPIATGLVTSLSRPGGNLTGLSATSSELAAKNLELVREILPNARRVGVLGNAADPFVKPFMSQIENGARIMGMEILPALMQRQEEYADGMVAIANRRADAVILQGSLPAKLVVDLALKHRIPAVSNQKSMVQEGALTSYSASFAERARGIASYVDRILKGAKPADLPVQQPSTFELVINMKTAKALGLTIPPTMLARADEVLE